MKQEEERQRTHGAELIDPNDAINDLYFAIDLCCFNFELMRNSIAMRLYYIPNDLARDGLLGLYTAPQHGAGYVMISKPFYKEHGLDDEVMACLFHEMVHAYCRQHKIKDVDGGVHLKSFADACAEHGGVCRWGSPEGGYNEARLTQETTAAIRHELKTRYAKY